jgi:hypothetical protein
MSSGSPAADKILAGKERAACARYFPAAGKRLHWVETVLEFLVVRVLCG